MEGRCAAAQTQKKIQEGDTHTHIFFIVWIPGIERWRVTLASDIKTHRICEILILFLSHSFAARPASGGTNGGSSSNPSAPAGASRSVRSCNCCPYGYHIDLDFVRYCEALAQAKPSEEEQRRRDRRRSRKSMEFMLGFESLFGTDWQAETRVQDKLTEVRRNSKKACIFE